MATGRWMVVYLGAALASTRIENTPRSTTMVPRTHQRITASDRTTTYPYTYKHVVNVSSTTPSCNLDLNWAWCTRKEKDLESVFVSLCGGIARCMRMTSCSHWHLISHPIATRPRRDVIVRGPGNPVLGAAGHRPSCAPVGSRILRRATPTHPNSQRRDAPWQVASAWIAACVFALCRQMIGNNLKCKSSRSLTVVLPAKQAGGRGQSIFFIRARDINERPPMW